MPKREITVSVLPIPDVPNVNGILFEADALKEAIQKYMDSPYQHVMLQKDAQVGDMKADVELDKLCGSVTDIQYNEDTKSYDATIKLIPNKNSAFVLEKISEGISFTLGTNKVGMLCQVNDDDETEYPEGTTLACQNGFDIISTSLLPNWVIEPQSPSDEVSD